MLYHQSTRHHNTPARRITDREPTQGRRSGGPRSVAFATRWSYGGSWLIRLAVQEFESQVAVGDERVTQPGFDNAGHSTGFLGAGATRIDRNDRRRPAFSGPRDAACAQALLQLRHAHRAAVLVQRVIAARQAMRR